jgi:hypothetical protein
MLVLFVILVLKLWPNFLLDKFRQDMFAVRDALFDYAQAGNISFSHPAYRLLRQSMNGYIRYAHRLSFICICLTLLQWRFISGRPEPEWGRKWEGALKTIRDERIREALRAFHAQAFRLIAKRVVFTSPILIAAFLGMSLYIAIDKGVHNVRQLGRTAVDKVLSSFVDPKLIDEEAARCAV